MIVENRTTGIYSFGTLIGYVANLFLVSFILYLIVSSSKIFRPASYFVIAGIVIVLAMIGKLSRKYFRW